MSSTISVLLVVGLLLSWLLRPGRKAPEWQTDVGLIFIGAAALFFLLRQTGVL